MGIIDAVRNCLSKYVTFSGRARRPEYWWFALFTALVGSAASLIDAALAGQWGAAGPVWAIGGLALLLPNLAVTWRRLHDVGRSGWLFFLPYFAVLITAFLTLAMSASMEWQTGATPVVFQVLAALGGLAVLASSTLVFVWLVSRSQPGPNRFGPEPAA